MEKKVVAIGNGLAVFIDKAYQRELDIRANTLIRMSSDGVRLVIEPAGERTVRPKLEPWDAPAFLRATSADTSEERRLEYYAAGTFKELIRRGLSDEHFARLHHFWDHSDFYWSWLCRRPLYTHTEDYQTLRRIELCWERVAGGSSMVDATEYARAKLPLPAIERWMPFGNDESSRKPSVESSRRHSVESSKRHSVESSKRRSVERPRKHSVLSSRSHQLSLPAPSPPTAV